MTAYYNEFDIKTAAWLEELIARGLIAYGHVDTRSIEDVRPSDLRGYTQCHFFAGIGVWSYALRGAGWSDDRPVWTGSCPCQPFSAAGKGSAFADERHLWPAFHHLIKECKPAVVLGEQVASKAVDDWIDLVHADLEAVGYTFGSVPFPSAGVGAPHIRDRNYWVAHSDHAGLEGHWGSGKVTGAQRREDAGRHVGAASMASGLADADSGTGGQGGANVRGWIDGGATQPWAGSGSGKLPSGPSPTNGYWSDADWLGCRDGKWRPIEPGTFPLVNGASARVVRLRGYGNAVNAEAAKAWIEVVMQELGISAP